MIRDALPTDYPTKKIARQEAAYEAEGTDPERVVPLPFDLTCVNTDELISRGLQPAGVVRQMNQVFVENIGNLYAARVRSAASNKKELPSQEDMDALVESYDFSGVRAASEAGMSEEDKVFRSTLRTQLKRFLRMGVFHPDQVALTVQTQKEAKDEVLPENKISIEDFDTLVESAAEGVEFQYLDRAYDFSGEPKYNEQGQINNFAAITDAARHLAEREMELKKQAQTLQINASVG